MGASKLLWGVPSIKMAWRNLGRNRIRTGLAALGIVIGVVAIASLGMVGAALQHQASADLGGLANQVIVTAGGDNDNGGLTDRQLSEIETAMSGTVIPEKSDTIELSARNGEEAVVSVTGVTQANELYGVSVGEAPVQLRSGALLSNSTAERLDIGLRDPVSYNGQLYRVRGLINSTSGLGRSNNELVVPMSALSDQDHYSSVTVLIDDDDSATAATVEIESLFTDNNNEVVSVTNYAETQERINSFLDRLNLALLGIGSISLVVAGVAILNVMLMSTVERRGEIGVLRAVGIRRGEVLRMILAEAMFLGVIGGFVGAVVSLATGAFIFDLVADNMWLVLDWESSRYLLLGFGFAVAASLISGLYPAWTAANDRPVEALRE